MRKMQDRYLDDKNERDYIKKLNLQDTRSRFRVRSRITLRIKANRSSVFREDMACRHCTSAETESQEHIETCTGRQIEQWGLYLYTFSGKVIFWRWMGPVLRNLDDGDKIAAYKEKVRNLPDRFKDKTRAVRLVLRCRGT